MQIRQMGKPNRITEWIKRRKTTLEKVSGASGLSVSYLSRMASGEREVTLKNLVKIAKALDVRQDDLIKDAAALDSQFSARERKIIAATLETVHLRIRMLLQISAEDLESTVAEALAQPLSEARHLPPSPKGLSTHQAETKESRKSHR